MKTPIRLAATLVVGFGFACSGVRAAVDVDSHAAARSAMVGAVFNQPPVEVAQAARADWAAAAPDADAALSEAPVAASSPTPTPVAGEDNSDEALAKKLSNPISSLISVPFQFNYDGGYGPNDAGRFVLNVQPVIPFTLSKDWNLIVRTIVPVINQESPAQGIGSDFGLGDILQSFFFSPSKPTNGITWGIGPAFLWPSATNDNLGAEKWGAGPTAVVLKQEKAWTYGMLFNHIWSYADADDDDREHVSSTFLQPFISYTWPSATTLTINTESTYDWNSEQWTVPLNLQVSQLVKIGGQRISLGLGGRYYAESPGDGPQWGVRFVFTLLFPK